MDEGGVWIVEDAFADGITGLSPPGELLFRPAPPGR